MKEITVAAKVEELSRVIRFVNETLEAASCRVEMINQIDLAVEEIFVNIAYYAYSDGEGTALVGIVLQGNPPQAVICFSDQGRPYNPLARENPDLLLPLEARPIGGLGIFLARTYMDSIEYEYKNGKNRLTIRKWL